MTTLNINNSDDPSYRYKMPIVTCQQQGGKIDGRSTILTNLNDVTTAFNTPSSIVLKFIGFKKGLRVNDSNNSITGHHTSNDIIDIIFQYIDKFVICPNCGIPELLPIVEGKKKKRKLFFKCSACCHTVEKNGKNNDENKGIDLILKYLENNDWKIKKGNMVLSNDVDEKEENLGAADDISDQVNSFNPFDD
jgi:translation initiation factor 5